MVASSPITRLRLWLNPPVPWVVLLGPDGSGKSTVLHDLEQMPPSPLIAGVQLIYRHPGFLFAHRIQVYYPNGDSTDKERPVIDHYAAPPRSTVGSIVKLGILTLDWFVGYWSRVLYQQAKKRLVLFDRHAFLDLRVDPLRYRYSGPPWVVRLLGQLLPKPGAVILLDAPVEVLQSRKQEVSPEEATRQRLAYLKLVKNLPNGYIVDASRPLDQVVADVWQIILDGTIAHAARR